MLDLNELSVFIRVVDEGSFTRAGKALGVPKSRISRMVADLEDKLGCRLLQRTTRQLSLTEVGSAYYSRCRHLVREILDVHEIIADREENPQGLLRIAIPKSMGSAIVGHYIARYQSCYPEVRIEVVHYDNEVNLVQEGFDAGIFLGDMPDSSLVARTLLEGDSVLCAAPAYLVQSGRPAHPRDLEQMQCIRIGEGHQTQTYELIHRESGDVYTARVEPVVTTDLMSTAMGCLQQGRAICEVPYLMASEQILSGNLVPLFSDWILRPESVSIAYPSRQYLPQKVRVFIDFVVAEIDQLKSKVHSLPVSERPEAFISLLNSHSV